MLRLWRWFSTARTHHPGHRGPCALPLRPMPVRPDDPVFSRAQTPLIVTKSTPGHYITGYQPVRPGSTRPPRRAGRREARPRRCFARRIDRPSPMPVNSRACGGPSRQDKAQQKGKCSECSDSRSGICSPVTRTLAGCSDCSECSDAFLPCRLLGDCSGFRRASFTKEAGAGCDQRRSSELVLTVFLTVLFKSIFLKAFCRANFRLLFKCSHTTKTSFLGVQSHI